MAHMCEMINTTLSRDGRTSIHMVVFTGSRECHDFTRVALVDPIPATHETKVGSQTYDLMQVIRFISDGS